MLCEVVYREIVVDSVDLGSDVVLRPLQIRSEVELIQTPTDLNRERETTETIMKVVVVSCRQQYKATTNLCHTHPCIKMTKSDNLHPNG